MQIVLTHTPSYTFHLHLNTSRMRSMSVVRTLMPSMLAIVQIGTNWSLSIWDIRYKSLERFSLNHKMTNPCRLAFSWDIVHFVKKTYKALRQLLFLGAQFTWIDFLMSIGPSDLII